MPSRNTLIGLAVSALFLLLFVRQLDGLRPSEAVAGADLRWLALAVPVYFAGVWFRALRWRALLSRLRPLPATEVYRHVVMGYMANDLLPARTGELVRAYLAGRSFNLGRAPVLGTIAVERISDGLTLVALLMVAAPLFPLADWLWGLLAGMGALFLAAAAFLVMALRAQAQVSWAGRWAARRLPARAAPAVCRAVAGLLDGLASLREPRLVARIALYAVAAWGWEAGVCCLTGLALGLDVPPVAYLLAMCTANLATALPSSQAGIGPFEFFCAQTMTLYGLPPGQAAAFALLVHAVLIVPVVLAGLWCLARENLSVWGLLAQATGPAQPAEAG